LVFTHVSTAYVNSDKQGSIEEKVYDMPGNLDAEVIVQDIMKMTPAQLEKEENKILGSFPNTYTFAKAMVERTLLKRKGNLKLAIVRPSIVISAYEEPFSGWTETISAMGSLLFAGILGLVNYLNCDPG